MDDMRLRGIMGRVRVFSSLKGCGIPGQGKGNVGINEMGTCK